MQDYIYYINGIWEKASKATVPLNDTGFLFGDGLFETIRFDNRKLFHPERHLERLHSGLQFIHIRLESSDEKILELLTKIIQKNELHAGLLRLMVTRGNVEGPPWKYVGAPSIYINIRPLSPEPNFPVNVVFYPEVKYPIIRFTPAIKSLNYMGNMLAKKDADDADAFEPVFYNADGFITECAIRNIFFIKGRTLLTPDTKLGVLPGVMRNTIISIAQEINLTVEETTISIESINEMDEAFISSTGIGLLPCFWDGWQSDFILTSKLKNHINQLINTTS
jgi:branched-subunit amino acid aminotransferase/4-amino-4-deoxychorismate lyase